LGEVNKRISTGNLRAMTTAAVVAYYRDDNKVKISYAGHPHILYRPAADKVWSSAKPTDYKNLENNSLTNLPLAVDPETLYGELTIPSTKGDQFFIYTDGVIEARSPDGEYFGIERLKDILDVNSEIPINELKSEVLRELRKHTEKELTQDDITIIAMEIEPKIEPLKREKNMTTIEQQKKAFNDFYNLARNNDVLEPKTTLLIHMATAISVGCYP